MKPPYLPGLTTVVAAAALATACGSPSHASSPSPSSSTSPAPAGTASASVGDLHLTGAYIPKPASSDEAAAYLTVTNDGSTPDTLLRASSTTASSVSFHDTVATAAGVEEMTSLPTPTVPAHGSLTFSVGHKHLMLENPKRALQQGDKVALTLVFAHAGTVTLQVPVTSLTGPGGGGGSMPSNMPGMDMSGS